MRKYFYVKILYWRVYHYIFNFFCIRVSLHSFSHTLSCVCKLKDCTVSYDLWNIIFIFRFCSIKRKMYFRMDTKFDTIFNLHSRYFWINTQVICFINIKILIYTKVNGVLKLKYNPFFVPNLKMVGSWT